MNFLLSKKSIPFWSIAKWQIYEFYSVILKCQGLSPSMNYRVLLSYSKSEPVCEARRLRAQGLRLKNILECLEGMDLLEERKSDTPHRGTRSRTDGISLKQGLDTGWQSLCVGGNGEATTTPQMHTHSPDLFCFLFLSMKDLKLQMALKKMAKYHILGLLSQQRKKL